MMTVAIIQDLALKKNICSSCNRKTRSNWFRNKQLICARCRYKIEGQAYSKNWIRGARTCQVNYSLRSPCKTCNDLKLCRLCMGCKKLTCDTCGLGIQYCTFCPSCIST